MEHPTPWTVKYWRRFPEWDAHSCPYIVDANGETVVRFEQTVMHPGLPDPVVEETARRIVEAVNKEDQ